LNGVDLPISKVSFYGKVDDLQGPAAQRVYRRLLGHVVSLFKIFLNFAPSVDQKTIGEALGISYSQILQFELIALGNQFLET